MTTSRKTSLKALAAIGAACVASALVTPQAAGRAGVPDRLDARAPDNGAASVLAVTDLSTLAPGLPALATAD